MQIFRFSNIKHRMLFLLSLFQILGFLRSSFSNLSCTYLLGIFLIRLTYSADFRNTFNSLHQEYDSQRIMFYNYILVICFVLLSLTFFTESLESRIGHLPPLYRGPCLWANFSANHIFGNTHVIIRSGAVWTIFK